MPRFLDRYLDGDEWEAFLDVVRKAHVAREEPDQEALQERFKLSQRTTKRTIRRAEKALGLSCTVAPEISKRKKRRSRTELVDSHLTPLQKLASSIDWRYMTVIEKAHQILPGRITETRYGYVLDGRPCRIQDIVSECNAVLDEQGIATLPC